MHGFKITPQKTTIAAKKQRTQAHHNTSAITARALPGKRSAHSYSGSSLSSLVLGLGLVFALTALPVAAEANSGARLPIGQSSLPPAAQNKASAIRLNPQNNGSNNLGLPGNMLSNPDSSSHRQKSVNRSSAAGTAMNLLPVLKPNDALSSALSSETVMNLINPADNLTVDSLKDNLQATPDPIFRTANHLFALELVSSLTAAKEKINQ